MATPVVFNAVNYSIPAFGDIGYAQGPGNLSSYLIAIATGTLQPTGGLFSLTSDINFGPNFGLVSTYYKTTTANIATAGQFRLAVTDTIQWRNNANTLNLPLAVNGADQLTFNGVVISTAAVGGTVNPGVAGRLTLYPAAGNTVDDVYVQNAQNIDVLIATQAARTVPLEYTIPNPGNAVAAATFALLELAQTFTAAQTFAQKITISAATNQIVLGTGNTITLNAPAPIASHTYTIPDILGDANFVMSGGNQTIVGVKTFAGGAGAITMSASTIAMGANKITGLADGTVATDAATFGQITAQTATTSINGTFIGLGRNRVINGDMVLDQRNEGAIVTTTGGGVYGVDKWIGYSQVGPGIFKTQRLTTTPPTGFNNYTHITVGTQDAAPGSGAVYVWIHYIEGYNIRDFLWGSANALTITVSFWVRSNLTGTFAVGLTGTSGGARSYTSSYTINAANTWEKKTITIVGDTAGTWLITSGPGVYIVFDIGTGSAIIGTPNVWQAGPKYTIAGATKLITSTANTLDVTGVQLEIGSTASSFEYVPFPDQLTKCQRYYEKSYDIGTVPGSAATTASEMGFNCSTRNTNTVIGTKPFKVTKRASPTVLVWNESGGAGQLTFVSATGVVTNRNVLISLNTVSEFWITQTSTTDLFAAGNYAADADF